MSIRLEVIQYLDESNRSLVARVPAEGTADIKFGAQLIVMQNQEAIFFRDGKAMDAFSPGRYTLTTQNIPFITRILTIPWERSPFQACVYFIGKQTFLDQKWGTPQPITVRDKDFGMVRLRSFGKYSFRVTDGKLLLNTLVGTQGKYNTEQCSSHLRDLIISRLADLLASSGMSMLDLPSRFDEIATGARARVSEDFSKYGLELVDFFINAITPPEEVQKAIDARSSMGAVGDLNAYMKFQTANSLSKMAEKEGGENSAMGVGFGAGFGMMFPQMIREAMQSGSGAASPGAAQAGAVGPAATAASAGAAAGTGFGGGFGDLRPIKADPKALVKAAASAANAALEEGDAEWKVVVPVGPLRKQTVRIKFDQDQGDGAKFTSFQSVCGPASDKNTMVLLRYNTKMIRGAFAVEQVDGQDMIVIQANLLNEMASAVEVTQLLAAVAWQADKAEETLLGEQDTH